MNAEESRVRRSAAAAMVPLTLKVVVRVADCEASRRFYGGVLALPMVAEWDEPEGRGCIFASPDGGALEVYEMRPAADRFDPAFRQPIANDKVDIQFRTPSLDAWLAECGDQWPHSAPQTLPWGQRWVQLRDPDNLLVAVYEDLG